MNKIILKDVEKLMLQEVYDRVDSNSVDYDPIVFQVIWLANLVITRHGIVRITPEGLKELLFNSNSCITIGSDCMKADKFINDNL